MQRGDGDTSCGRAGACVQEAQCLTEKWFWPSGMCQASTKDNADDRNRLLGKQLVT